MRDVLKSSVRWLRAGWLWALVLLTLPVCGLSTAGASGGNSGGCGGSGRNPPAFNPGPEPWTSAVMCDIPKPNTTQCATAAEVTDGVATTRAAVALVQGESRTFALDYAPAAKMASGCNDPGVPVRTEVYGSYPVGFPVCLNCGTQLHSVYADANAVCVAKCKERITADGPAPPEGVNAFCEAKAHVSTNFDKTTCFDNACSAGTLLSPPTFVDPRRFQERVKWFVNPNDGTTAVENSVMRTKPTTGGADQDFNAGSAAAQVIARGEGWVEFEAGETGLSHVLGVSTCKSPCTDGDPQDNDPSLADITFAISLNNNGNVYVLENLDGNLATYGPFGDPYGTGTVMGERFRVKFADNNNGAATISYSRLIGPCEPATVCTEHVFHTSQALLDYPLRVDTSFREQSAALENVRIVRIR